MSQTAYCAVAAGLLDVPAVALGPCPRTSPAAAPAGRSFDLDAVRFASRSSTTSACASPMHHSTSWWVSGLRSSRIVGSSATSRPRPGESLSSSALVLRHDRDRQQRLRHLPGLHQQRLVLGRERVAGLGRADLATAQMSPAMHWVTGRCCLPSGEVSAPTRSSTSWSSCPLSARPCPETCTVASGRSVPEKTRTSETRPDVRVGRGLDHLGDQRAVRVAGQAA